MKSRTTRILIETRRVWRTGEQGQRPFGWCAVCARQATVLTPAEAAGFLGVDVRAIYHLIAAGQIHSVETAEGFLLSCLDSLGALSRKGK